MGEALEMAPLGGDGLDAGGVLGGEERDDLTKDDDIVETANVVDTILLLHRQLQVVVFHGGIILSGSRRNRIRCVGP